MKVLKLKKIISGGQTGADIGGVKFAKDFGFEYGGTMPRGFRTQKGNRPEYAQLYNMKEHSNPNYPPRTLCNVRDSDVTLVFGNENSSGCTLTRRYCDDYIRDYKVVKWPCSTSDLDIKAQEFRKWLVERQAEILNVAGNREESQPGIEQAVYNFLKRSLIDECK